MVSRRHLPVWTSIVVLCSMFLVGQEAWLPPCMDSDGDGYGDPASKFCEHPEADCDDMNPYMNPGALESLTEEATCSDRLDNDCDGFIDDEDVDCLSTPPPEGTALIDENGVSSSLALGPQGLPGIAYTGPTGLEYAAWNPRALIFEYQTLDLACLGFCGVSLQLNQRGEPSIAYFRPTQDGSRIQGVWAHRTGSIWSEEIFASFPLGEFVGSLFPMKQALVSLSLSPSGDPRIAYFRYRPSSKDYAVWLSEKIGYGWQSSQIASSPNPDFQPYAVSLSIDKGGQAHILVNWERIWSSHGDECAVLYYAKHTSLGWESLTLDLCLLQIPANHGSSLVVDTASTPHVTFCGSDSKNNNYLYYIDMDTWQFTPLQLPNYDPGSELGGCSIAVDIDDRPFVAYYVNRTDSLSYLGLCQRVENSWDCGALDSSLGPYFVGVSLALDPFGRAHIALSRYDFFIPVAGVYYYRGP